MFRWFFIFLLWVPLFIQSEEVPKAARNKENKHSPRVSQEVLDIVKPYLMPSDHPIKPALDKIFSYSRVTANAKSVKKAGFLKPKSRPFSHCTVSHHPLLKGYLVKLYTDDQTDIDEVKKFVHRIEGAHSIQASIDKHHWNDLFKVPKKWIYMLPANPAPKSGRKGKNFVLVVEDVHIYRKQKNYDRWKGKRMTEKRADALWVVMYENGLTDSIRPFNIPFCKDGKQAFIDTEHHHKWPVHFGVMTKYFGRKLERHWRELVHNGGPLN